MKITAETQKPRTNLALEVAEDPQRTLRKLLTWNMQNQLNQDSADVPRRLPSSLALFSETN